MAGRQLILCAVCVFSLWSPSSHSAAAAPEGKPSGAVTADMLQPQGEYCQATVPDTLDLAERAKLSVHGLTSFLDAKNNYAPWGHFSVDSAIPALLDRRGEASGARKNVDRR